jgi:hypothetical protein
MATITLPRLAFDPSTITLEHLATQTPRPPTLGYRRRTLAPNVEADLRRWLSEAYRSSGGKLVALSEWISLDPRTTPHTLLVQVKFGTSHRDLMLEKASERLSEEDVRRAVRARESQ